MSKVATRFAPSPTGALHIGGVRTAYLIGFIQKIKKEHFILELKIQIKKDLRMNIKFKLLSL